MKKEIFIVSYDINFSNGLKVSIDPTRDKCYTIKQNPFDQIPRIGGPITIEQLLDHLKELKGNKEEELPIHGS